MICSFLSLLIFQGTKEQGQTKKQGQRYKYLSSPYELVAMGANGITQDITVKVMSQKWV